MIYVRLIPDGSNIELTLSGDKLNISAKNGKYSLATLPSNEVPGTRTGDAVSTNYHQEPRSQRPNNVHSIRYGQPRLERHYLNGLFLKLELRVVLTAAATDAHRLALN